MGRLVDMILQDVEFLELVKRGRVERCLKSYADSLLFYWFGMQAVKTTSGDLLEIGPGGSTWPLMEISERTGRRLSVVDYDPDILVPYRESGFFHGADMDLILCDSDELDTTSGIRGLCYAHIDGSKDYNTNRHDLEFCWGNLKPMGLICQDDYGNNKWPTVTDSVWYMLNKGILRRLFVGDSSAWLCRTEDYHAWINILRSDREFGVLRNFLQIQSSANLSHEPQYYFMHASFQNMKDDQKYHLDNVQDIEYCRNLLSLETTDYLQMPYRHRHAPGTGLGIRDVYLITKQWDQLRGDDWPKQPPHTREDIDRLPSWILDEIRTQHQIDPYGQL